MVLENNIFKGKIIFFFFNLYSLHIDFISQAALPPVPQRPAVMAGNEIVAATTMYSRLSNSNVTTTEIVPSTSSSHKHFKRRETQVLIYILIFINIICIYFSK